MNEPEFVSLAAVLELHEKSIAKFGGDPSVRDLGLIESALASAVNTYLYANADLFEVAASYAYHLSESQAFVDGNKRTALKSALTFLELNEIDCLFDELKVYDLMMQIATKQIGKAELAEALRMLAVRQ